MAVILVQKPEQTNKAGLDLAIVARSRLHPSSIASRSQQMQQFKVSGMSCGHCSRAVTQAIQALEPTARVEVDLAAGLVRVETSLEAERIEAAIREEGYQVEPA
jgi:copper chaperone